MRILLIASIAILSSVILHANDKISHDVERITDLLASSQFEQTQELILTLKEENDNQGHDQWNVKANLFLGYTYVVENDFGKAIIYYLEAIRHAEQAKTDYNKDLMSLYNRCAVIYRQYNAYELAHEYYKKGLTLANRLNDDKKKALINYNLAGLLTEQEFHQEAISLLEENLTLAIELSYKVDDYYNRLALAYYESKNYIKALEHFYNLEDELEEDDFKMIGYSYHNKALVFQQLGDNSKAIELFKKAIEIKTKHSDPSILFSSHHYLGKLYEDLNETTLADGHYSKASDLLELTKKRPEDIEVLKDRANSLFKLGDYENAKKYEDLYSDRISNYLNQQRTIEETDKMYNMDLITKRYFDEVKKQERIGEILLYSKLTSGSLLALLLLVVGYYRFEKVRLRKNIEQELISLKILD